MMRLVRISIAVSCLIALQPRFTAADERIEQLPEPFRTWLEAEVGYIISDHERDVFLDLQSIAEREAFIDAFWRSRDPDPLTKINEFQNEHYRRIRYANHTLGREAAIPGWMTDRGRMYIILGEPNDRSIFANVPGLYPAEVWFYYGDREKALPPLYLLFFRPGDAGAFRLYNHFTDRPEGLIPTMRLAEDNLQAAYRHLRQISPELANAAISMRADQGGYSISSGIVQGGLDSSLVLANIYKSPYRRIDASYTHAAVAARGLVEAAYLFNYMPSFAVANVLPGPAGGSLVHFSIEIDPEHFTLVRDESRFYTSFELHVEVSSASNEILYESSKLEYLELEPSQLQQVGSAPFAYRNSFPLVEGDYQLRIIFKNRARNEYTIFERGVQVPEWGRGGPVLGEPVLLYNAEALRSKPPQGVRSYRVGRLQLHPNAKHLYAVGERIRVHVPLTGASRDYQLHLQIAAIESTSAPLTSKSTLLAHYAGGPIIETIELPEAVGGRYQLEIELLDSAGAVVARRYADFDITPRSRVARPWAMYGTNDLDGPASVLETLAEQHLKQGEKARSKALYEQALEQEPDLPRASRSLAWLYLDEGQASRAISLLTPLNNETPGNYEVIVGLGESHRQLGEFSRAAELFEHALELRDPEAHVLNALASCYVKLGNIGDAVAALERSLALLPDQDAVRDQLKSLRKRGKTRESHRQDSLLGARPPIFGRPGRRKLSPCGPALLRAGTVRSAFS